MRLSAPIYHLKTTAKRLSRDAAIPLNAALDRVAASEGFASWSLLASQHAKLSLPDRILAGLSPGELILLAARPRQGKTVIGLELAARAAEIGRSGYFFSLDFHERDVAVHLERLGLRNAPGLICDTSDDICADHVVVRLKEDSHSKLAVIDYLQLLDQNRSHPPLNDQVAELRRYAKATGAIIVQLSQIDRRFDLGEAEMPRLSDIRTPNPLDLSRIDRVCFVHQGRMRFERPA